jgi:hypothetical protein
VTNSHTSNHFKLNLLKINHGKLYIHQTYTPTLTRRPSHPNMTEFIPGVVHRPACWHEHAQLTRLFYSLAFNKIICHMKVRIFITFSFCQSCRKFILWEQKIESKKQMKLSFREKKKMFYWLVESSSIIHKRNVHIIKLDCNINKADSMSIFFHFMMFCCLFLSM